jgi:hypothetical protein
MGIRTPDLLHAMQVRQPACQRRYTPLPADPVHRRPRECLPDAACWLSTWLSAISVDHDLFECPKARCTAHAGNAERCPRGKNTAAAVIGDVTGRARSVTRDRFAAFGSARPVEGLPRRLQDLRHAPREHGAPQTTLRTWPRSPRSATGTARRPAGQDHLRSTASDRSHGPPVTLAQR